jgi:hypothetical protein
VGGVLTPKGQIVIDPSFEYDYWAQNQLRVNGFQIIPGITFGNIFVTRFEQNISTAAVTVRGGVTDRLELNAKIPYVYNAGSTSSLIPVGTTAELLSVAPPAPVSDRIARSNPVFGQAAPTPTTALAGLPTVQPECFMTAEPTCSSSAPKGAGGGSASPTRNGPWHRARASRSNCNSIPGPRWKCPEP